MTDSQIIIGILSGDKFAEESLFKQHRDYCLKFMNRMNDKKEENVEIFIDALLVFIERLRSDELQLKQTSIQTYLNSICRNQVLKRLRENKRLPLANVDGEIEYSGDFTEWFNDESEAIKEKTEITQDELNKMQQTEPACYQILRLRYFENKSTDSIIQILGYTSSDSVKTQMYRCRETLRKRVIKRLDKK